jgi:hypothetical protein
MAKGEKKKEGDPLKMYCTTMALLVVVMAVLYFVIENTRKNYETSNEQLVGMMRFEGKERAAERPPSTIPDLSWEVESLAETFKSASGGSGLGNTVPRQMMETVATKAGLKQSYASGESTVKGGGGTYETVSQRFEYTSPTGDLPRIWQLLDLVWNIESRGRYRVSQIDWNVAEVKDNAAAPFDKIKNPQIEVSLRVPLAQ